jgi:hypothetical protein
MQNCTAQNPWRSGLHLVSLLVEIDVVTVDARPTMVTFAAWQGEQKKSVMSRRRREAH